MLSFTRVRALGCLGVWLLGCAGAMAHPISLTAAQAEVRTNGVTARIEVMLEDFMMFYGLMPGDDGFLSRKDIERGIERHKATLLRDFIIRDVDGERLAGSLVKVTGVDIPEKGVESDKLMDHRVTYHLQYPLAAPPTHLTFLQTFGGEASLPAVMELEVRQEGLAISDSVMLSNGGARETFDFDWTAKDRPGGSAEEAWRRRREERKKERMGIDSYDAIYGFVYIVDHEVRVEILIPLLTLETWLAVERKDPAYLEIDEQQEARTSLETFLREKNTVKIDGIKVKPTLKRLDFYGLRFSDFAMRPEPRRLSALTARVGVILSYDTKGPPAKVDITWEYFNAAVFTAKTAIYAYDKTLRHQFSVYKQDFSWKNPGTPALPNIVALEVGKKGKAVEADAARAIAGTLLKNVYRAFDYRGESDIYNALARSVQGDLLAELYLKIRKGLIVQEQGGAIAHVNTVAIEDGSFIDGNARAFNLNLTWTVEGTVEHWGHIHTRVNRYSAAFGVRVVKKEWKIDKLNVLEKKRVKFQVKLRSF